MRRGKRGKRAELSEKNGNEVSGDLPAAHIDRRNLLQNALRANSRWLRFVAGEFLWDFGSPLFDGSCVKILPPIVAALARENIGKFFGFSSKRYIIGRRKECCVIWVNIFDWKALMASFLWIVFGHWRLLGFLCRSLQLIEKGDKMFIDYLPGKASVNRNHLKGWLQRH